MTRALPFRRLLPVAATLVAVAALAACGSDSSSSDSTTTTKAASPSTAAKKAAVIVTTTSPTLGRILVDAGGKTVYTLTKDGKAVACTGACLGVWPPVKLPAGETTATGGPGVTGLGVSDDQVTADQLPLYTFAGDAAAGQTGGEGIESFGGVWHVVKVGGASSTGSTTPTTAKS